MNTWAIMRLALGALAAGGLRVAAQNPPATHEDLILHMHVYNFANVPGAVVEGALEETARVFATARVRVVWELAEADLTAGHTLEMTDPRLAASGRLDHRGFLVVRMVRGLPLTSWSGALGFALPTACKGVHVTMFYDRIETVAQSVPPGVAKILGNAMAHEIGHILLGSGQHSQVGIMKGVWSRTDYLHLAGRSLEFQAAEVVVLREEVSRRTALGPF